MRHVPDSERRARLAVRHGIAPWSRLESPEQATAAMTVLHATEPATVHLSLWARTRTLSAREVERALEVDRALVKQLAMRRTLFVFPRDLLPAAWGSASARVATALRARLVKEVAQHGIADDAEAWLGRACADVLECLADGTPRTAAELREAVPALATRLDLAPGTAYAANVAIGPRVLTQLGVEAAVVRGRNDGHWRTSRPRWTTMGHWLGEVPEPWPAADGYAELVRRWLRTFGPGTEDDLVWWLGATRSAVRRALADVGAVAVSLDDGEVGHLLADDLEPVPAAEPWVALLPVLDPTVMGWKDRRFFVGDHAGVLFDRNGNAGTTAWVDGRVVGCWVQSGDGTVRLHLLEDVDPAASRALEAEASRLTAWLDGVVVGTVYTSPAMKEARGAA